MSAHDCLRNAVCFSMPFGTGFPQPSTVMLCKQSAEGCNTRTFYALRAGQGEGSQASGQSRQRVAALQLTEPGRQEHRGHIPEEDAAGAHPAAPGHLHREHGGTAAEAVGARWGAARAPGHRVRARPVQDLRRDPRQCRGQQGQGPQDGHAARGHRPGEQNQPVCSKVH